MASGYDDTAVILLDGDAAEHYRVEVDWIRRGALCLTTIARSEDHEMQEIVLTAREEAHLRRILNERAETA